MPVIELIESSLRENKNEVVLFMDVGGGVVVRRQERAE